MQVITSEISYSQNIQDKKKLDGGIALKVAVVTYNQITNGGIGDITPHSIAEA